MKFRIKKVCSQEKHRPSRKQQDQWTTCFWKSDLTFSAPFWEIWEAAEACAAEWVKANCTYLYIMHSDYICGVHIVKYMLLNLWITYCKIVLKCNCRFSSELVGHAFLQLERKNSQCWPLEKLKDETFKIRELQHEFAGRNGWSVPARLLSTRLRWRFCVASWRDLWWV